MLFPRSHSWTRRQKRLIVVSALVALAALGALVYGYERYYRGPSEAAFFGTWQDMTPAMDSFTYYRFRPDGTFDILGDLGGDVQVDATGTWYAGGPNIYWRLPAELTGPRRPLIWHIDDISPNEIRVRELKKGPVTIWRRIDLPTQPHASNQAMQRTASKPATGVRRVCHPRFECVAGCSGLAVADLVSR